MPTPQEAEESCSALLQEIDVLVAKNKKAKTAMEVQDYGSRIAIKTKKVSDLLKSCEPGYVKSVKKTHGIT